MKRLLPPLHLLDAVRLHAFDLHAAAPAFRQIAICNRLPRMHRLRFLCFILASLLLSAPLAAQEEERARQELLEVEERLEAERLRAQELAEEAEALRAQLEELRQESTETAARIQLLEAETSRGELAVAFFRIAELRTSEALGRERGRLASSLSALQRLGLLPPESALVAPGDPMDALRAARLLSGAVPALEERARRYRELHQGHITARTEAQREREALREGAAVLADEQQRLAGLIERRQEVLGETRSAQQEAEARASATVEEATSLRELIEQLAAEAERERQRRAEEARRAAEAAARAQALREAAQREAARAQEDARHQSEAQAAAEAAATAQAEAEERQQAVDRQEAATQSRSFPAAPATILTMPAQGRVATTFGETTPEMTKSQGLVIETRGGAQVVAPFEGRVAYAGEFRRYGLILIIEHDGRYHSLLAGLGHLSVAKGQWVQAGEPVGSMAPGSDRSKELYLELRRAGQPVDPQPWLAEAGTKARG